MSLLLFFVRCHAFFNGGSDELLPNIAKPAPLRGVNPGIGFLSVFASASTCACNRDSALHWLDRDGSSHLHVLKIHSLALNCHRMYAG